MKTEKSKLLLKTFDGSLVKLEVKPKYLNSSVKFDIKYYDYDGDGSLIKAKIIFNQVIAVNFEVNYFDNCIGSELFGFYEIFCADKKKEMIEKIFNSRMDGYRYHGDYNYDPNEDNDILNNREAINTILLDLGKYHLYQQQTQGGIYYILATRYDIVKK